MKIITDFERNEFITTVKITVEEEEDLDKIIDTINKIKKGVL
ncbi:hypothetical protein LCGC14_0531340 [marine sediment metagenome]|uniref:Uncharacterized protein n=1 Tax=marine sediment metagenome TaxID=412755 RepID=A0A0F9V3L6_9ZZZZ